MSCRIGFHLRSERPCSAVSPQLCDHSTSHRGFPEKKLRSEPHPTPTHTHLAQGVAQCWVGGGCTQQRVFGHGEAPEGPFSVGRKGDRVQGNLSTHMEAPSACWCFIHVPWQECARKSKVLWAGTNPTAPTITALCWGWGRLGLGQRCRAGPPAASGTD